MLIAQLSDVHVRPPSRLYKGVADSNRMLADASAGTWLEEERAHYRLARSLLQAGNTADALQSALRCVEVCSANDAPAFEFFFARLAVALARRAAGDAAGLVAARREARDAHARLAPDDAQWCTSALAELEAGADPA